MFNPMFQGKIKKSAKSLEDNKFMISGHMSVPVVDLEGEIIGEEAYDDAIETVKTRNSQGRPIPIFIEHRRKELSLPVGKITDAGKDNKGLWFKGEIADGPIGEPIRDLVKGGYLYGCSIGGDALKTVPSYDDKSKKHVNKITKMAFRELSLTGLPVNEEAVFSIAKSMNKDRKEVTLLMDRLNEAINVQTTISALEKAVEPDKLDEAGLNRIKDALNDLAGLLKIDLSESGMSGTGEMPVNQAPTDDTLETKEEIRNDGTEEQGVQAAEVETEQVPEEEEFVEESTEEAMVNTDETSKLDEINQKLDQLLSHESKEEEMYEEDKVISDDDMDDDDDDESDDDGDEDVDINIDVDNDDEDDEDDDNEKEKKEDDNMEYLKCKKCGESYEIGKSYSAKHCPECGDKLVKSKSEDTTVAKSLSEDLKKSIEATVKEAVDKALASVKVAPNPDGADTKYDGAKEMPKGEASPEGGDSIAVAPNPKGAKTRYKKSEKEEKQTLSKNLEEEQPPVTNGNNVASFGDGDFLDADRKDVTDTTGSDIQDQHKSQVKILPGNPNEDQVVAQYGKDRLGKSVDDRLEKIEKSIEKVLDKSEGRKSVMTTENDKIEKSQPASADQATLDRNFASYLLGK